MYFAISLCTSYIYIKKVSQLNHSLYTYKRSNKSIPAYIPKIGGGGGHLNIIRIYLLDPRICLTF